MKAMNAHWCSRCNVPVLLEKAGQCPCCGNAVDYLATDIRPVFYVEKLILEFYLDRIGNLRHQSIWKHSKNRYYYADGKRLNLPQRSKLRDSLSSLRAFLKEEGVIGKEKPKDEVVGESFTSFKDKLREHCPLPQLEIFVNANQERLAQITDDAIDFVKRTVAEYPERIVVVSFSGGKDSTVVSHLVRRALGKAEVLHIFSDTTLEDPLTYSYIKRFRTSNSTIPFFIPKSEHDFFSMCDEMGPPTQYNRWCCTIFKTGPISNVLNSFGKDILTFYGVRHAESNARSGYEPISRSKKITKQIVASPIIGWSEIDVWLYILANYLDYNNAYDFGFSRAGCWLCPLNSDWSNFLTQLYLPDKFNQWRQILIDFAIKIGKLDPQEYVDRGKWSLRYGGIGKEAGRIRFKSRPCGDSEYAKSFRLDSPLTEKIREYFKPFGRTTMFVNKYGLLTIQVWPKKWKYEEPLMTLGGRLSSNDLKIIVKHPRNYHLLSSHIEMQLSKFLTCTACGGCSAVCPNNAVITAGGDYRIDEEKCTGCHTCVSKWARGCLVADTLRTY